ncbi:hypothetical protein BZL30_2543 [Mycobacterium kansasii]|uniref:Uncharacterized protein n=1 Tax=Mycobacterium kansasii TaxID=1768 RepID=A0A1V3XIL3_MYCKA|nr:hypothetical protein BZL30_2543 [Mycobacterium kansasii]
MRLIEHVEFPLNVKRELTGMSDIWRFRVGPIAAAIFEIHGRASSRPAGK